MINNNKDSKISSLNNGNLNDRSFAAALLLQKVAPSESNHDKIKALQKQTAITKTSTNELLYTTSKKRRKTLEKKLRSWIKNSELILDGKNMEKIEKFPLKVIYRKQYELLQNI